MTDARRDRAAGALLGHAAGDALGAGYEFGDPLPPDAVVAMLGGGSFGWAPGEWTDDTQMAVPLLDAAEEAREAGGELTDHLDAVVATWSAWALAATDVGNQTRRVLGMVTRTGELTCDALLDASRRLHEETGRTAGNGSLMRTSPVALAYLGRDDDLAAAARLVSSLTHWDDDAGDACVLWCLAISHAIGTGELDLRRGLAHLPRQRQDQWEALMLEAENKPPVAFPDNGWVVHAFQAAWSAITTTAVPAHDPKSHLRLALENAVRAGHDTDTVAAIAGQVLGAYWGASAIPDEWAQVVHGWPGLTGVELAQRGAHLAVPAVERP
jgi:ADP-ribosylglycohydrolase